MAGPFEEVAVYFSRQEWAELAGWQRRLYREVMLDTYGMLASLGGAAVKPEIICKLERGEMLCVPDPPGLQRGHRSPVPGGFQGSARGMRGSSVSAPLASDAPVPGAACEICLLCLWQPGGSQVNPSRQSRPHPVPVPQLVEKTSPTCPKCDKSFRDQTALAAHERCHTGERPFTCANCGKSFSQKGSLITYQRFPTGERPFACTICDKPSTRRCT
ncbi:zinc finger protein 517-like [Cuculus canorus]|uniref:zinc finger protein 517-like n=1 Tax=Cuculus canorus TaxID=55661 RepID=UPI0023AA88CE|nr:zinc finger protein 517-like [Cuculus canorus]